MEELNRKTIDRAVLVGLNADCFTKEETATETTLDELEALLNTAGGECAGKVLQNKHTPDPRSFIGEGKAEEVRQLVLSTGANMVIFDNDLTPSQTRTLEDILKTTVLDRSALILDIFAQRAKTREGKLQVELAQYQYYLPRLTVWNEEMGRLGGGIGTRGPGETQLETDKRYIRSRIQKLRENLEDVRKVRAEQRRRRQKNDLPVVALVGYTNAGKSTLLNRLTGADIPANNRLFDTLDTTTRQLTVSDTVSLAMALDKLGAAGSYLMQAEGLSLLGGDALPLGILENVESGEKLMQLHQGDTLILLSDGVEDAYENRQSMEEAIRDALTLETAQDAANAILTGAQSGDTAPADDQTVLVLRLIRARADAKIEEMYQ